MNGISWSPGGGVTWPWLVVAADCDGGVFGRWPTGVGRFVYERRPVVPRG